MSKRRKGKKRRNQKKWRRKQFGEKSRKSKVSQDGVTNMNKNFSKKKKKKSKIEKPKKSDFFPPLKKWVTDNTKNEFRFHSSVDIPVPNPKNQLFVPYSFINWRSTPIGSIVKVSFPTTGEPSPENLSPYGLICQVNVNNFSDEIVFLSCESLILMMNEKTPSKSKKYEDHIRFLESQRKCLIQCHKKSSMKSIQVLKQIIISTSLPSSSFDIQQFLSEYHGCVLTLPCRIVSSTYDISLTTTQEEKSSFGRISRVSTRVAIIKDFSEQQQLLIESPPIDNISKEKKEEEEEESEYIYPISYLSDLENIIIQESTSSGILVIGESGCGKSFALSHICIQCGFELLKIDFRERKTSEIISKIEEFITDLKITNFHSMTTTNEIRKKKKNPKSRIVVFENIDELSPSNSRIPKLISSIIRFIERRKRKKLLGHHNNLIKIMLTTKNIQSVPVSVISLFPIHYFIPSLTYEDRYRILNHIFFSETKKSVSKECEEEEEEEVDLNVLSSLTSGFCIRDFFSLRKEIEIFNIFLRRMNHRMREEEFEEEEEKGEKKRIRMLLDRIMRTIKEEKRRKERDIFSSSTNNSSRFGKKNNNNSTVIMNNKENQNNNNNMDDFVLPSSSSSSSGGKVLSWDGIGGLEDVKLKLKQYIEWPLTRRKMFEQLGFSETSSVRGILLYGPPGCGKTSLTKAVARQSQFSFFYLNSASVYSPYVGDAEACIRNIFSVARKSTPSLIFLDELDALVGNRGGGGGGETGRGSSGVERRVLSSLLNEMDGIEETKDLVVIGATNRPDRIDRALLRPGRFDYLIYVPRPGRAGRKEIIRDRARGMVMGGSLGKDKDITFWDDLAKMSEGMTGAEVEWWVQEAGLSAIRKKRDEVIMEDFKDALKKVYITVSEKDFSKYEKFFENI